jgi:hypothetical protein
MSNIIGGPRDPRFFGTSPQNPSRIGSPAFDGVPGNPQQNPVFPEQRHNRRWMRWLAGNPPDTQISIIFDPNAYAWLRGELVVTLPTAGGSVLVLNEANTYRNFIQMRNSSPPTPGTDVVFVSFGKPASVTSLVRLGPRDAVGYTYGAPQDEVHAFGIDEDETTPSTTARLTLSFSNALPFTGPDI